MMPPNNLHPKHPSSSKESETQPAAAAGANNNRKPNSSSRPQDQAMKCPRCDSPNTKFCYYNNYSLTQPRHFCKTCRRYWTKGGALRNVPIGGGCRKNKKMMKSSSSSTSSARTDSSGSSDMGASCSATGFKFFAAGLSPAMDFNLGGLSFPRLNLNPSPPTSLYNNNHPFPNSFADISASCGPTAMTNPPPCFTLDPSATATGSLLGFNYNPLPTVAAAGLGGAIQDMGGAAASASADGGNGLNINTNLASSIESLSCMNQDLHWKLQQQRLAMLFGRENNSSSNNNNNNNNQKEENHGSSQINKPQPILFQNLEISKQGEVCSRKESGETATEWFFGNSYGGGGVNNNANSTNSSSNGNDQSNNSTGYHHHHHHHHHAVQQQQQQQQQAGGWGDLHQYNALP